MFTTAFTPVDLKTGKTVTLKVKGAAQIDIYIFDSNRKRAFKINDVQYYTYGVDGEATDPFTKKGSDTASKAASSWDPVQESDAESGASGKQWCYSIPITSQNDVTTITLLGGQQSVYPLGVVLKKTADSE